MDEANRGPMNILDRYYRDHPDEPLAVNHKRVRCSCGGWMMARYTLSRGAEPIDFVCPRCESVVPFGT